MAQRELETELEYLRIRVTALERAVRSAGIVIPPTTSELAAQAQEDERRMQEAARRGE